MLCFASCSSLEQASTLLALSLCCFFELLQEHLQRRGVTSLSPFAPAQGVPCCEQLLLHGVVSPRRSRAGI